MAEPIKRVDIYHFNDFHRHLESREDGSGGAARLSSLIRQARASHPDAVVVNGGDVAGDNAVPGPDAFDPLAPIFNKMGVDVLGLGNHEFEDPDGDYASLREGLIKPFRGDVLAANVTRADGTALEGTRPYTIRQLAGVNVAFIGVVTRELSSAVFPAAGAGLYVADLEGTLRDLVPKVRAEGAEAVVVLAHDGLKDSRELARAVPGVDVVLAAHDHNLTREPIREEGPDGPTWVAEAGGYGLHLGHLSLEVSGGKVVGVQGRMIPVSAEVPPDPEVQALVDAYVPAERVRHTPAKQRWETFPLHELKQRLSQKAQEDSP